MKNPLVLLLSAILALVAVLGVWLSTRPSPEVSTPASLVPASAPEQESTEHPAHELEGHRTAAEVLPTARETAAVAKTEPQAALANTVLPTLLEGTFVDENRVPIVGVQATVDAPGGRRSAVTGTDGRMRFEIPLKRDASDVTVRASADGCAAFVLRTRMERGRTADLGNLVMHAGGDMAGVVLGPDGSPFEGAKVSVGQDVPPRDADLARVNGPELPDGWPTTKSGAGGVFSIEGVPARNVRLWVTAEGMRHTSSDVIEIMPRRLQGGLTLRMEALARDEMIEGVVRSPDDKPVARARVRYSYSTGDTNHFSNCDAEEDGRFRIRAPKSVPFELHADDRDKRWQGASRANVLPGMPDVVLRLSEARWIELSVVADSSPVLEFGVSLRDAGGTNLSTGGGVKNHADGRESLIVPVARFWIKVVAPRYSTTELGPFEPQSAPSSVVAQLQPLPGLQGRVLADGRPVSGARLELHKLAGRVERIAHNGYPARLNPQAVEVVTSGVDGRYRFTARDEGDFAILCIAEGHALAELSPIAVVPRKGADALDFALVDGGSIEGRVLVRGGQESAGIIVSADRGDARARTLRTGSDGAFRFSGLTPGAWNVARAEAEINLMHTTTSMMDGGEGEFVFASNCVVEDGRTTRFDIDLRDVTACVLNGHVEVNHAPALGWSVHVTPASGMVGREAPGGTVDANGDVRVEVSEPGSYGIALRPPAATTTQAEFSTSIKLARGPNPWTAVLDVGALEASGGAPGSVARYTFEAALTGDIAFHAELSVDLGGACSQPIVPAGAGVIHRMEKEAAWNWREVGKLEIDVPVGGVKRVTLP